MELLGTKERPSYVRFERLAVEDRAASIRDGQYVARDVDYALITAAGSKDIFKTKAVQWMADLKQQAAIEKIPLAWVDHYKKQYDAWLNGQELPINGTPIKGWGVISPAQQTTLIHNNVFTVEDLATLNDEGLRRIGMGAVQLRTKAAAWVAQLADKGPLTQEIAAVRTENVTLKLSMESMQKQLDELRYAMKFDAPQVAVPASMTGLDIDAAMAAPVEELPTLPRRGRPRKSDVSVTE